MKNTTNMKKQEGVALVIGLILLLVITVIGINSMKSALLQEKMSSTLKNRELADAAALTMLVAAERYLYNYYSIGNNTTLGTGAPFIVAPDSDESIAMRKFRNMETGFSYIDGLDIDSEFDGQLHDEPVFIIEDLKVNGAFFGAVEGETDGGASGSMGGDNPDNNNSKVQLFRIVSKANDSSGNIYSAFESVMSVRTK